MSDDMVKKRFTIKKTKIELDEEEALDLIAEILKKFDWIGTTITKDDVEEYSSSGKRPSAGLWEYIGEKFYDEVQRFIEDL